MIKCLICGKSSGLFATVFSRELGKSIGLLKCNACGIVFTHPHPSNRELQKLYPGNYYEKPSLLIGFLQKLRVKEFGKLRQGEALDVGCGQGFFVNAMALAGWKSSGLEVSMESKKYLKKQGFDPNVQKFYFKPLPKSRIRKKFDLITYWHAFEHIQKPNHELQAIKNVLDKNGVLFLALPNIESISYKIFGQNWFHLDAPRHVFHYSPKTVSRLLAKNGFIVKKINHYSFEYNPFGVLQSTYNAFGFRHNFLYEVLRKRINVFSSIQNFANFSLTLIMLPLLAPLSIALSYFFSMLQKPDTFEVWAEKTKKSSRQLVSPKHKPKDWQK